MEWKVKWWNNYASQVSKEQERKVSPTFAFHGTDFRRTFATSVFWRVPLNGGIISNYKTSNFNDSSAEVGYA